MNDFSNLKSLAPKGACRFEPGLGHHDFNNLDTKQADFPERKIGLFDFLLQCCSISFHKEWIHYIGDYIMDISSLVGGLGIGSVLTLFLKEYFDNRKIHSKRAFEEKKDAYIKYLEIAALSQTLPANEAIWARTAAIERIKLCGSSKVVQLLVIVSNTPPNSPRDHINTLIQAMREDLFPNSK